MKQKVARIFHFTFPTYYIIGEQYVLNLCLIEVALGKMKYEVGVSTVPNTTQFLPAYKVGQIMGVYLE